MISFYVIWVKADIVTNEKNTQFKEENHFQTKWKRYFLESNRETELLYFLLRKLYLLHYA